MATKRYADDRPDLDRFLREALARQAAEKEVEQAKAWAWRESDHG